MLRKFGPLCFHSYAIAVELARSRFSSSIAERDDDPLRNACTGLPSFAGVAVDAWPAGSAATDGDTAPAPPLRRSTPPSRADLVAAPPPSAAAALTPRCRAVLNASPLVSVSVPPSPAAVVLAGRKALPTPCAASRCPSGVRCIATASTAASHPRTDPCGTPKEIVWRGGVRRAAPNAAAVAVVVRLLARALTGRAADETRGSGLLCPPVATPTPPAVATRGLPSGRDATSADFEGGVERPEGIAAECCTAAGDVVPAGAAHGSA